MFVKPKLLMGIALLYALGFGLGFYLFDHAHQATADANLSPKSVPTKPPRAEVTISPSRRRAVERWLETLDALIKSSPESALDHFQYGPVALRNAHYIKEIEAVRSCLRLRGIEFLDKAMSDTSLSPITIASAVNGLEPTEINGFLAHLMKRSPADNRTLTAVAMTMGQAGDDSHAKAKEFLRSNIHNLNRAGVLEICTAVLRRDPLFLEELLSQITSPAVRAQIAYKLPRASNVNNSDPHLAAASVFAELAGAAGVSERTDVLERFTSTQWINKDPVGAVDAFIRQAGTGLDARRAAELWVEAGSSTDKLQPLRKIIQSEARSNAVLLEAAAERLPEDLDPESARQLFSLVKKHAPALIESTDLPDRLASYLKAGLPTEGR